jgi:hypothetical protein
VGQDNLTLLRGIGYPNLERWSNLLLSKCVVVESVIEALTTLRTLAATAPDRCRESV